MLKKDVFEKLMSMVLAAFFGVELSVNICSASLPIPKITSTQVSCEYVDSDKDPEFLPDSKKEELEQQQEEKDLEDMRKKAVWARNQKK